MQTQHDCKEMKGKVPDMLGVRYNFREFDLRTLLHLFSLYPSHHSTYVTIMQDCDLDYDLLEDENIVH